MKCLDIANNYSIYEKINLKLWDYLRNNLMI